MLTDNELWEKCQTGQPITKENLGINEPDSIDGLVHYKNGMAIIKTKNGFYDCWSKRYINLTF